MLSISIVLNYIYKMQLKKHKNKLPALEGQIT